jgi:type IV secretion system protein VirD4
MDAIDDAIDKYRGYGIRLQLYYQSIGQLKKCFPDGQDQTLLSNTTQVFFGVNESQTAEYISNRLGEQTIVLASGGTSTGSSRSTGKDGVTNETASQNTNSNWSQHGRKLLKPEEIMHGLSPRIAITFVPGMPPIWTTLVRYYERGFPPKGGLSFWKCAFDTVALFFCAAIMATVAWAACLKENPQAASEARKMYERVIDSIGPNQGGFGEDPDFFKE